MKVWRGSAAVRGFVAVSLLSMPVGALETVIPQDLEYVTIGGVVFDGALPIPGNRAGALQFGFSFSSDVIDPTTGLHVQPTLTFAWSIENSVGAVTSEPDGQWFGRTAPPRDARVETFDAQTGAGFARVSIPFAYSDGREYYHYPAVPEGMATVTFVADWLGALDFDSGGAPINPRWTGELEVVCVFDDVFISASHSVIPAGDVALGIVGLRQPAQSVRHFTLVSSDSRVASLSTSSVTIGLGEAAAPFEILGDHEGVVVISVFEGGVAVASSERFEIVVRPRPLAASLSDGPSGGWEIPGQGEPVSGYLRECHPPSGGNGKANHKACGKCTLGTPTVDCPEFMSLITPARCSLAFSTCATEGTTPITGDIYEFTGTTIINCFNIEVAVANAECCQWRKLSGETATANMLDCADG